MFLRCWFPRVARVGVLPYGPTDPLRQNLTPTACYARNCRQGPLPAVPCIEERIARSTAPLRPVVLTEAAGCKQAAVCGSCMHLDQPGLRVATEPKELRDLGADVRMLT